MNHDLSPLALARASSLVLEPDSLLEIQPQFGAVFELTSLDGSNGFRMVGDGGNDQAGYSVASAGDVNGDGFTDVIVGAKGVKSYSGAAYVVFGHAGGFEDNLQLDHLDGTDGFQIPGEKTGFFSGASVSSAGDINGDGYDDVIIGARGANSHGVFTGAAYVVFGHGGGFDPTVDLSQLDGTDGFRINAEEPNDRLGDAVSSAGDVNGDGYDDVLVSAPFERSHGNNTGAAYVVFGKASGFTADFETSTLDGSNGFKITGASDNDLLSISVSKAGDINGDGYGDVIVGAVGLDNRGSYTGGAYVVFGRKAGFPANIDVSSLDGDNGFKIVGENGEYHTGQSVSSAGDVNGDGFDDLVIGAVGGSSSGGGAGDSYVVFGKADGFSGAIGLSGLNGENGFRIEGASGGDYSGASVASAGDVNGDGFADIIVGAYGAADGVTRAGACYVIYGKASGFSASMNLADLDGSDGFRIDGETDGDNIGHTVSSAGDINGDGLADLIIGAARAGPDDSYAGITYVVFGQPPTKAVHYTGTDASQSLVGGELKDVLSGQGGDDALWGHGGKDKLTGGTGDDTLVGGAGKDVLVGQAGADVFQYRDLADSTLKAHDTIKGLGKTDVIDLHLLDADAATDGDQAFHIVSAFSGEAGELTVSFDGKQTLVQGDIDGDGAADLVIAITGDHHDFAGLVL